MHFSQVDYPKSEHAGYRFLLLCVTDIKLFSVKTIYPMLTMLKVGYRKKIKPNKNQILL